MADAKIITVLEPIDEYTHQPDPAPNYNESMYLNCFDLGQQLGAWFRIGNRVNEGYAEVTVCVYLPEGRVGFLYSRPEITNNDEMNAGGLKIEVVEPFERLRIGFGGRLCVLDEPRDMAHPRTAFESNPFVESEVHLDVTGVSPMFGGMPVRADGKSLGTEAEKSFAKAHYEQHTSVKGTIRVGDEVIDLDGLGLRDKSWGPRYWQAIRWYRWLPMIFSPEFAMMLSIIDRDGEPTTGGMVLSDGRYHPVHDCRIESEWDDDGYQTAMHCSARTDEADYEVDGTVLSMIPLRNRRTTDDGEHLVTRITEAMTSFECNGMVGMGMSEYLDQIVDGRPVGTDFR